MYSRRKFLKESALITAGSLIVYNPAKGARPIPPNHVVVLGGGFAGLSAAYHLHRLNIKITVLEAQKNIGGRVKSLHIPGEPLVVELGAEWVGESHEKVQTLCDELNLPLIDNCFETHLIYKGRYAGKGGWKYSEAWDKKWSIIRENYLHLSTDDKEKIDKIDWWRFLVNNGCEGRDLEIRELLDSTDFGESIRHISAFAALSEYAESSAKNEMDFKIKGGNNLLAQKLADRIGRSNILTEHLVLQVNQQSNQVIVQCANGKQFVADKIICCLPTFAVQKINWLPGLPPETMDAIQQLQYARINKHPVLFSTRFWPHDFDLVTDAPAHYFYNATREQPAAKGVLMNYTIGDKAAVMASQNVAVQSALINQALMPAFGNVQHLMLKHYNYYWGNNPFSQGAYAAYKPGQWFSVRKALQQPFMHTHFAGEHLADWQGFMEGALASGEDAALAIAG